MRILLVEDDEILTDMLVQSLTAHRYAVDTVNDGQFGLEYAQSSDYDLVIIDVGLPRMDGITLCEQLRHEGFTTPILLMTAKDATSDRIRGLDAGADDYLTKPLDLDELQARVRALLRRGDVSPSTVLESGLLTLNPVSCEVTYGEKRLLLTPKEYSLLELLMRNPSRVFSRGAIIEHLWTFDDPPLEDSVKAHIKGLRRKLKQAGAVDWVENVYGLGYRFVPKHDREATSSQSGALGHAALQTRTGQRSTEAGVSHSPSQVAEQSSTERQFDQAMAALWVQYGGLMAERMQVIQSAVEAIATHSLHPELQKNAAHAAHKLAGVLGMFGRDDGTLLARELESLLEQTIPAQLDNVPVLAARLAALIDESRLSTEEAVSPPLTPSTDEHPVEDAQILFVSDDPSLAQPLSQLAQDTGLTCHPVSFAQSLDTLLAHHPDLVVVNLDPTNPATKDTGLSLLSTLRSYTPPTPAIALLPTNDLDDRVAIARYGISQVLPQTTPPDRIWESVTQVLQRSRTTSLTVLAVDDDPIILTTLRRLLSPWNMRVMTLEEPKRFWTILNAVTPDLLILDVEMPDFSGIELCRAVRTDAQWSNLPILFLTAHREAATVQQVFEAGGDDYVTKPIIGPELLTRIMNRMERNRLLQHLSQKDTLTGLPNQRQSSHAITTLLHHAQQSNSCLSFVVLTLTDLKALCVRYGHEAGHQVLQRWGQVLRALLPTIDGMGYWEHGEFVVALSNVSKAEVSDSLADVLKTLRQQVFTTEEGDRFQAAFEMAIAQFPQDGTTLQALYQATHAEVSS